MIGAAKKLLKNLGIMKGKELGEAKKYIVWVDGEQQRELLTAGSLNAAEAKAKKKYPGKQVSCEYTEESINEGKQLYWPVNHNGKKLTKKPMGIERANAYLEKYTEKSGEEGGLRAAVNLKIDPKAMVKGQAVMQKGSQYDGWKWVGVGKSGVWEIEKDGTKQQLDRVALKQWQRTSHPSYDKEYEFNIESVQEAENLIEHVDAVLSGKDEVPAALSTTEATCNGKLINGPDKAYTYCPKCKRKDYEANEGDRCGQELPNDKLAKQPTARARKEGRDFIEEMIDKSPDPDLFRDKLDEALARRYALRTEGESELMKPGSPDVDAFNTALAKLLQKLKKDLGAEHVKQNYKGTGSQKHRRQIFVRFPWGSIDLWLNNTKADLGGVISPLGRPTPAVPYENRRPEQVYADIVRHLKMWKDKHETGAGGGAPDPTGAVPSLKVAEGVTEAEYLKPFYGWTPKQKKAFKRAIETEGEIVRLKLGDGSTENYFYKNGEVEVRLLSISASRSEAMYYDTEGKFLRRGH